MGVSCEAANEKRCKNIRTMIKSFDITEKHKIHSLTSGGSQETTHLSYTGLVKLLVKSKKPNVEIFCRTLGLRFNKISYIQITRSNLPPCI